MFNILFSTYLIFQHIYVNPNMNISPKANIIIVHSLTQQPGCLNVFAKELSKCDYKIVLQNLRGHGQDRFDELSYDKSLQDLLFLIHEQKTNKLPIFIVGESVGAALAIRACTIESVDGLILISAGNTPQQFDWKMIGVDFIWGITNLNRQIDVTKYILKYSSDDPRITHEMVTDPLSRTTLNGKELIKTALFLKGTKKFVDKLPENLPILILQGTKDKIVKSAQPLFKRLKTKDKKLVYINSGHIIIGSSYIKPEVIHNIKNWLNDKLNERK